MTHCQKCGARVDADDEFCPDCGAKILPAGAVPAREAMQKLFMQQGQPKKHRFFTAVIIIIGIILLLRACASFASQPQIPYSPEQYTAEVPADDERLISIETPPPMVNPVPEPLPGKDAECYGVAVKITDACESSNVDADYFYIENTGSKPILGFNARYYTTAIDIDEGKLFGPPLDVGGWHYYYSDHSGIKMIEVVPIIVVNGEEVVCDKNVASYGNAYGEGFPVCE